MKHYYPPDGGLKEPVRSLEDSHSAFVEMIKHFFSRPRKSDEISN